MNERFLFRGKGKNENSIYYNKWVFGNLIYKNDEPHIFHSAISDTILFPATLGQCTGLKDKNGKLIFEGDIAIVIIDGKSYIGTIEFHAACYFFKCSAENTAIDLHNIIKSNIEATGNIHDTPDLLQRPRTKNKNAKGEKSCKDGL